MIPYHIERALTRLMPNEAEAVRKYILALQDEAGYQCEEDVDEVPHCQACNGTGEGTLEGLACRVCKGKGF